MKNKKRIRSLLGMTVVLGIGAAVVWQIDPLRINRIPLFLENSKSESFVDTRNSIDDDTLPSYAGNAPDQTVSNGATEPPPIQEFVFETEPSDEMEREFSASEIATDDLFGPTPVEVAAEISVEETELPPRKLNREPLSPPDSSIIRVAGTEPAAQSPATVSAITPEHLLEIDRLIANGEEVAAHKRLSAWYWNHPEDRPQFQARIEQLAQSIYFSAQPHYETAYVIQPGDQLRKVASQYKLSWQYLARLNQVNPRKIRIGQKLKVVSGPLDAVVDLSEFQLTVLCRGQYVRHYRVGIGKDGTSPIGKFTVKEKLEDPVYYGPDGVIANNSPDNPLGERWIDIGDSFGIHGTIDPQSIGKSESRGCIRMLNDDVAEVYDFLTIGSTVWIRR